jgi:signal transduction histidine kinase
LVSDLDLESILGQVLDTARDLTGARYAALGVVDESKRELERFLTVGIDAATRRVIGPLPRGQGVLGELINNPKPLRLKAVGDHPRSFGFPPGHPPMDTFLGVPIVIQGEAYGNLYLTEKAGGVKFDEADERTAIVLADWAGVAIHNARLYSSEQQQRVELQHAVRSLEATTAIARALGGETDLDMVLDLIVKRGRALVDARAALMLIRDGHEIEVRAAAGELAHDLTGRRFPLAGSIAQQVLDHGKPQMIADIRSAAGDDHRALVEELGIGTALLVPLEFRGRGLGVLIAADRVADSAAFSIDDERLMQGFAASAATAVATAQSVEADRLRQSIEASEQERRRWARELHDETLQDLGALKVMFDSALQKGSPERLAKAVADGTGELERAIGGLHSLIMELRPAALDELGIAAAVSALVERRRAVTGIDIGLDIELASESSKAAERLAPDIESATYRLVQEALTNASKHAEARHVEVSIAEDSEWLTICVTDDGDGFDIAAATAGLGLIGMRERVELIGGVLDIESARGSGTAVRTRLPARGAGGQPMASSPGLSPLR